MKVLQLVHNYPPEFRGGVERAVENMVEALAVLGVESTVLAGSELSENVASVRSEVYNRIRVHRVVGGRLLRQPADPFRADLASLIDGVFRQERPDVIHVHHWWNLGNDLVRRAALHGIPAVVTLHDHFSSCARFFRLPAGIPCGKPQDVSTCGPCLAPDNPLDDIELTARIGRRHSDFCAELAAAFSVMAPSLSHAARCESAFPGLHVKVVPLGSQPIAAAQVHRFDGTLRILHAGNLCRIKGVEVLCEAVRKAVATGAKLKLTLAGPCVESGMNLDGAELVGSYDHQALRELGSNHDVIAIPSLALESYSFALDEALQLGLPVMVSDRGALPDRLGGRGQVVAAGDVAAWANALTSWSTHVEQLERFRLASFPSLSAPSDHASIMSAIYEQARGFAPPRVSLEEGALSRLKHLEGRLADILAATARTHTQNKSP